MTKAETYELFAVMKIEYRDIDDSDDRIALWHQVLGDVPYELVNHALQLWLRDTEKGKWPPKPGELRGLSIEQGCGVPSAEEAWAQVLAEVRRIGSYGSPQFTCEPIRQAVRAIGWREICQSETLGVERAHFFRTYEVYRGRAVREVPFSQIAAGGGARPLAEVAAERSREHRLRLVEKAAS